MCKFQLIQGCISQGGGSHVTRNDVTWLHVIGSDLEMTSFYWKSLGSGLEGRKLGFCVYLSSYKAVTHRKWQSRDRKWRHVTSCYRNWPGSDVILPEVLWSGCKMSKVGFCITFSCYRAVTCRKWQSRDSNWRHVTSRDRKLRHFAGSHLDVAVECRRLGFCVSLTSYRAVTLRRWQSRGMKWCHMTSHGQKSPGCCHFTGSHLEVAVEGWKLGFV